MANVRRVPSRLAIRILGAAVIAAGYSFLGRHELLDSLPYKLLGKPTGPVIQMTGAWFAPVLTLVAALVVWALRDRLGSFSPVVGVGAVVLISVLAVLTIAFVVGADLPRDGDFGRTTLVNSFCRFAVEFGGLAVVAAAALAALVGASRGERHVA